MNTKFVELRPWLTFLNEQVINLSIYLWGAQGQVVGKLTIDDIIKKESTSNSPAINTKRVLEHIGDNVCKTKDVNGRIVSAFAADKARAFDCSGLASYWFMDVNHVIDWDHSANAFMKECVPISAKYRQPGDMVFSSINSKGEAGHIGYVAEDLSVTESKGRDYGVVNRPYSKGNWKVVGRPPYFAYELTRALSNGCRGNDVGQLQARLTSFGYVCGDIDNDFGSKTSLAVSAFQRAKGLSVDGVVGPKTADKLGFKYANQASSAVITKN